MEGERTLQSTGAERWWSDFNDRYLSKLIAMARKNNPDLKRAKARIQEAWQQRSVIRAALFPHSDFNGKSSYGLGSYDNSGVKWDTGSSMNDLAQLDVGWEVDLFGGIRRQVESVTADYEASIEGWRDFHVIITAEVALQYIALRTLDERIRITHEGVKSYRDIADIARVRREEGLDADVDLLEASARLKVQEAKIPGLESERASIMCQLASLVGTYPGQAATMLEPTAHIPVPPSRLGTGVPADLLRSRPDIRRAERKLQAQSARIGIATAELYPSLSLSGAITYDRSVTAGITNLLRRDLGLGPTLRWKIFHSCADQARIKKQEAGLEIELASYEEVVLRAVAEVEGSISGIHFEKQRQERLAGATADYRRTSELMKESYRSGLVDLQRLLIARQDALNAEEEEAATRGRVATHSVKLFKAIGGGLLPTPKFKDAPPSTH